MPVKRALAVAAACLAAAAIALAVTVAATSAATSAQDPPPSRENVSPLKEWDTDNLAAGSIGAKNYRIPYHNYRGYVDRTPAKPCIRYVYQGSELVRSLYDGSCPSGYSLLTRWCSYSNGNVQAPLLPAGQNTYNSVQGRRVSGDRAYDACPSGGVYNPPSLVVGSRHPQLCVSSGGILSLSRNCGTRATASRLQHAGCQSAVADAFFQTGGTAGAVNDFPVADYGSESEAGRIAATGRRDRGCVEFAEQQDRLQASVAATGHYLALEGDQLVLKANSGRDILNTRITSPRSAAVYGRWDQKGTHYTFAQGKRAGHTSSSWRLGTYIHPVSSSADYQRRVDTRSALRMGTGLASALVHPWNEATGLGSGQGNFACTRTGWIGCVERSTQNPYGGVVYFSLTLGDLGTSPQFKTAYSSHTSGSGAQHSGRPVHLSAAQDAGGSWCPAKWHPRGQDAAYAIGNSTGRTLSSINSETLLKAADAHWCRSDVRYTLEFTAQQHNTCGYNGRTACAAPPGVALPAVGSEFESYGRKNCYKTMTDYDETSAECLYVFPLPECDPDPDNNSRSDWREFTPAEVDNIGVAGEPLLVKEGAYCGTNINPPDLAGFDADPCVAVDVAVFENRPAGSNAEPGVDADDRTAAVSSSVAVFDLDISVPFPETASPPNQDDPDLGPIDPSGCADGEEERTNHGTRASPSDSTLPAASDQRKSTPASADPASPNTAPYPMPSSSSASNTAAPPSDYDADNSYAGVRANIAHRYASEIAENTCAAKREQAELVLAVLKARADSFKQWLADYKTAADSNRAKFAGYNAVSVGATGLRSYWRQDIADERNRAARVLYSAYGDLSAALVTARTRYIADTTRTVDLASTRNLDDRAVLLTAASPSGCVAHYDAEIGRLKGIFASAEATVLASSAVGIGDEELPVKNNRDIFTFTEPTVTTWKTRNGAEVKERGESVSGVTIKGTTGHTSPLPTSTTTEQECTTENGETTCETIVVTTTECSGYSYTTDGISRGSYTRKERTVDDNGVVSVVNRTRTENGEEVPDTYPASRTVDARYTVGSKSYKSTDEAADQVCPSLASVSGTTQTAGEAAVLGLKGTLTMWPVIDKPVKPTAVYSDAATPAFLLDPSLLLGRYDPAHGDREDLDDPNQLTRANAAISLGSLTATRSMAARTPASYAASSVPETQNIPEAAADALRTSVETAAADYRKAYTDAYDRAYSRALADMGGVGSLQQAVWQNFHWEYDSDSLIWGGYTQNSTSNTTLDDGTVIQGQPGCALMRVAKTGEVTVAATRLDFETSSYGTGNTFTARTAEQRECKVRRTRTPRLTLRYEPPTSAVARPWRACPSTMTAATRPCGTDSASSKTGDYYNTAFTPAVAGAEKFKLYPRKDATEPGEAEIINLRISIADSPPVLCHTVLPSSVLISNKAAPGANAVANGGSGWRSASASETSVYRPSGWSGSVSTAHCFGKPASGSGWAVFDDTAHSAMAGASLVYSSGISGIIGSSVLTNSSPVAYPGNSLQRTRFYGSYIQPGAVASTTGWNVPDSRVGTASSEYALEAWDKTRPSPVPSSFAHISRSAVRFRFLDCLPDIRNLAYIDNIAHVRQSPSQTAGFGSWDASPASAPGWYYPPASAASRNGNIPYASTPAARAATGGEAFAHPSASPAEIEQSRWVLEYHQQSPGRDQQPQVVAAVRVVPDVSADVHNSASLATARRICGTGGASVSYPASLSTKMGLLPYYQDTARGGQPLVIWTENNPNWCDSLPCEIWLGAVSPVGMGREFSGGEEGLRGTLATLVQSDSIAA